MFAEPGLPLAEIPFAADGGLNLRFYRKSSFRRFSIAELIQSQVRQEAGEKALVPAAAFQGQDRHHRPDRPGPARQPPNSGQCHRLRLRTARHGAGQPAAARLHPRDRSPAAVAAGAAGHPPAEPVPVQDQGASKCSCWRRWASSCWRWPANFLLFRLGFDLDFIPLFLGLVACRGYDAYHRYQRVRREKKFIEKAFKNYLSDSLLAEIMKNPGACTWAARKSW